MGEGSTETVTSPPRVQRFERLKTIEKEHKDALERAVTLNVPHAVSMEKETSKQEEPGPQQEEDVHLSEDETTEESSDIQLKASRGRTNWDELVKKLFKKSDSRETHLNVVEDDQNHQVPVIHDV